MVDSPSVQVGRYAMDFDQTLSRMRALFRERVFGIRLGSKIADAAIMKERK
jgi:hypothetical protein